MTMANSPVVRFSVLAVRRGLSLGVLYSTNRDDFALLLAVAAAAFQPTRTYTEREVNEVLREWLGTIGTMIDIDHVELRRWLVDSQLLNRDGFGRAYTSGRPSPELAALVATLSGVDLAAVVGGAWREREERKQKWVGSSADPKQRARGG